MQYKLLTGIIIALVIHSCKTSQSTLNTSSQAGTTSESLDTSKWYLTKIHQPTGTIEVNGKKAFIRFNLVKGSAGGNGSCNSFGSAVTVNGDTISFKNIFSTKMYCEAVQSIENSFLDQLQKVSRYEIKEKTLLLFEGEKVMLEFEK